MKPRVEKPASLTSVNLADARRAKRLAGEEYMARPRSADDFAAIRARMEELQRERAQAAREEDEGQHGPSGSYGQRISRTSERISRTSEPVDSPGRGLFRGSRLG